MMKALQLFCLKVKKTGREMIAAERYVREGELSV